MSDPSQPSSPKKKPYTRHRIIRTKEKDLAKAFRAADTDGTGSLSVDEYIAVFQSQGVNVTRDQALAFFKDKDRDHDGRISFDEFIGKVRLG